MKSSGLPYNGWPALVRHGRDNHYYHARDKGLLPIAKYCFCCTCPLATPIPYHAEEYGPTLEDYWRSCVPMCHRCHAMTHARFKTPNRWKRFLFQAAQRRVSDEEFPQSSQIVAMQSRFGSLEDIEETPMPLDAPEYFRTLSLTHYVGPEKVATLLVQDQLTGHPVEILDWTLYGANLEHLSKEARAVCEERGLDLQNVLALNPRFRRGKSGSLQYKRLYAGRRDA